MNVEHTRRLTTLLIGPLEHLALYERNPEFRQGIDLLARTLPRFVDAMAQEAQEVEKFRRRTLLDTLSNNPQKNEEN